LNGIGPSLFFKQRFFKLDVDHQSSLFRDFSSDAGKNYEDKLRKNSHVKFYLKLGCKRLNKIKARGLI